MSKLLIVALLSLGSLTGCSSLLARTSPLSPSQRTQESRPQRGLLITEVFPNSPAQSADLHPRDLITRYGEFEIVDEAGYFAARNHYEAAHIPSVEIVVWRGPTRMSAQVRSGRLGFMSDDYGKTAQDFMALIHEVNGMRDLPSYYTDRGIFKFNGSQEQELQKAKELVDQGERDGTLTPAQVLLFRIYLILDDAPAEDQKRLEVLLGELFASQPLNYIETLANDRFFQYKRYRAAIACFKEYLKTDSDDVSDRLNLGAAYNKLGMYSEANDAADYVFEHKLKVSEYGRLVGYNVKATASLGLKDYRTSIEYAKKAFSIDRKYYQISCIQLAAAETGDLGLLEEAIEHFQSVAPQEYEKTRIYSDAVKAYALNKTNQTNAAREIVKRWKSLDTAETKVLVYWRLLPRGSDVARVFGELMKA